MSLNTLITTWLGDRPPLPLARQQASAWAAWLRPIDGLNPVGEDPAYHDEFQRLREEVNRLSGADTEQVARLAEQLSLHTCKDLRVITYWLWARQQRNGLAGLGDGLSLLAALVERFATQVLPARPNSRKAALEWLAGSKVLDGLAQHRGTGQPHAESIVCALAWLDHALEAWPAEQRPDLTGLHNALALHLGQPSGSAAPAPTQDRPVETAAPAASAVTSARELLDSGRALAGYLRGQPQGWLAGHRVIKALRWDTVHQLPVIDGSGHTRLAPPRGEYRPQLQRLHQQQAWDELLERLEGLFAEGANHFWLDLQWYQHQALSRLPAPCGSWAQAVAQDLTGLLQRLPGLELLHWSDGSPFADETTREWISQHTKAQRPVLPPPAAEEGGHDLHALEQQALAQASEQGVDHALAWLAVQPIGPSGRHRWMLRLVMARVAEQAGSAALALHLFSELDAAGERQGLGAWEPDLHFEVKARLLKLLRRKAQRSDADRPALNGRMDMLLAALVAIDPVNAAALCS
ncbi:type VI secretion system protein TssA [Pseudomonas sp. TE3610]